MLSAPAEGSETLDAFEMGDHFKGNIQKPGDISQLISESPIPINNSVNFPASLVESVITNPTKNNLEENLLQNNTNNNHPFNHVGTSLDVRYFAAIKRLKHVFLAC